MRGGRQKALARPSDRGEAARAQGEGLGCPQLHPSLLSLLPYLRADCRKQAPWRSGVAASIYSSR